MNRSEMIEFVKTHPYEKVSHTNFSSDEYMFGTPNGEVRTEDGYLFEDWESDRNGIRSRVGGTWEDGWYLKEETNGNTECKN